MISLRKTVTISILVFVVGFFCLQSAQADDDGGPIANLKFRIARSKIYNPCTEQLVCIRGRAHIVVNGNITPNDQAHLKFHINAHFKGKGVNCGSDSVCGGIRYVGSKIVNVSVKTDLDDCLPFVINMVVNFNLNSKGAERNLLCKARAHITITPDWVVTAHFCDFDCACKGKPVHGGNG